MTLIPETEYELTANRAQRALGEKFSAERE